MSEDLFYEMEEKYRLPEETPTEGQEPILIPILPPIKCGKKEEKAIKWMKPRSWLNEAYNVTKAYYQEHMKDMEYYPTQVAYYKKDIAHPILLGEKKQVKFGCGYKMEPDSNLSQDEKVELLKRSINDNTIAGRPSTIGVSTLADVDQWNRIYILDFDGRWEDDHATLYPCIEKLYEIFPNAILIKPSNRSGINMMISATSTTFDIEEFVTYAITAYKIIKPHLNFREAQIEDQVFDNHFLVNPNKQLLSLNPWFFFDGDKLNYDTAMFSLGRDYPIRLSKQDIQAMRKTLDPTFYRRILSYAESLVEEKELDKTPEARWSTKENIILKDGKYDITSEFCIAGVPFTGKSLRWRIAKALRNIVGEDSAKQFIKEKFVQADNMLSDLDYLQEDTIDNTLIRMWILHNLFPQHPIHYDKDILLPKDEYLSSYATDIEEAISKGSLYLISNPGTGKTELAKKLFFDHKNVIIVTHQKSILNSKFASEAELKKYIYDGDRINNLIKYDATCPMKIICIWDQFVRLFLHYSTRGVDLSQYIIIFDECHNLVSQFGFRRVIFDVSDIIKSQPHIVLMTGTPLGDHLILDSSTTTFLRFYKPSTTKYIIKPINILYGKKNIFKTVGTNLKKQLDQMQKEANAKYDLVILHSNRYHNEWMQIYPQAVHYCRAEEKSNDVAEINNTHTTSKDTIVSTCFFGEGLDLFSTPQRPLNRILILVDISFFTTTYEIEQVMHRVRNAQQVDVWLCSTNTKVASVQSLPFSKDEDVVFGHYINHKMLGGNTSNYVYDTRLGLPQNLCPYDYIHLSDINHPANKLYSLNRIIGLQPVTLNTIDWLKEYSDEYTIEEPIELNFKRRKEVKCITKHNIAYEEWLLNNIVSVEKVLAKAKTTTDVISYFRDNLGARLELSNSELSKSIETMQKMNYCLVLRDALDFFRTVDNHINWQAMHSFSLAIDHHNAFAKGFYSKGLDRCPLLNKQLIKDDMLLDEFKKCLAKPINNNTTFRDWVLTYKELYRYTDTINADMVLIDMANKNYKSIFTNARYQRKPHHIKQITIRNKKTQQVISFQSVNEMIKTMQLTLAKYRSFRNGRGEFAEKWEIIIPEDK